MKQILLCLTISIASSVFSQHNFDLETLENLANKRLNELRIENNLAAFEKDEILDAVAFEQASYIVKSGKLEHTQDNKKMETLEDRLIAFEGFYGLSTENISQIGIGVKAQLEKGGSKISISTPEQMIQAVIYDWLSEELSRKNLLQGELSRLGLSIVSEDEKTFTFVVVTTGEAYTPPPGAKLNSKQYGILPYSDEVCDPFVKEHGTTESLFSDVLSIENNQIIFSFHSASFVDHIISNGGDAFAVDIIERKQFDCAKPNNVFPANLQDGFLMAPIKKTKLAALNSEAENDCQSCRKVKAVFGELPAGLSKEEVELNLKIIKDGHHCLTVPFNQIVTKNTKWYDFPLLKSSYDSLQLFSNTDTAIFNSALGGLTQMFAEIETYHMAFDSEVFDVVVDVVVAPSIEVNKEEIEKKLKDGLAIDSNDSSKVRFVIKENWEAYQKFKEGTYYQIETKDMNKAQEEAYLKEESQKDEELKTALENLTQFKITIESKLKPSENAKLEEIEKAMYYSINTEKTEHALYLQKIIYSNLTKEATNLDLLDGIDQTKSTLPLINNQILRQRSIDKKRFDGNPIHLAFLELYFVQQSQPIVAYNYHLALLEHWAKSNNNVKDIESWLKDFAKVNKKELSPIDVARAYLNYWVIAGDYYYEKQNFEKRKKAFNEVLKWSKKANLSTHQQLEIAKYLCHQDQFAIALQLLQAETTNENASVEILTYFLQAAIYHPEAVPINKYVEVLEKLRQTDKNEFCKLFSIQRMGIQMTKYSEIKSLYCDNCTN